MGTDVLTTIQTNVRASLADTGTLFPDAMVNAAINEVVADISRLAPRELVHVEVLHSRTVTDESFTSNHDPGVALAKYIAIHTLKTPTTSLTMPRVAYRCSVLGGWQTQLHSS